MQVLFLPKENILLIYHKIFILTLLQIHGKISILKDALNRIKFDMQTIY